MRVCDCPRASESVRVLARAGLFARVRADVRQPPCGCVCLRACLRAFVCVRRSVCARACACARVRAGVRSCARASVGLPFHRQASSRVCVRERACACVRGTTVCARLGAEWALWGPAVLIARPAVARVQLRIGATGFRCRARLPQAEPSAAAPSRRDGLREMGTRPWSTPSPAPSTSSSAGAAPTTSGRAPTEVRGRTRSGGGGGGYTRGTKGTQGV